MVGMEAGETRKVFPGRSPKLSWKNNQSRSSKPQERNDSVGSAVEKKKNLVEFHILFDIVHFQHPKLKDFYFSTLI